MSTRTPIEERFFAKVDSHGVCWEWTAATMSSGYGAFNQGRALGTALAHRWAYEYLVGPIPEGLQLDHLCRNRRCVNPDHLEPVPPRVNTLRGGHLSALNARKDCCPKCNGQYSTQTRPGKRPFRYCKACQGEWHRRTYRQSKEITHVEV